MKMCIHSEVVGYEAGRVKDSLWFVSYRLKFEKKDAYIVCSNSAWQIGTNTVSAPPGDIQ